MKNRSGIIKIVAAVTGAVSLLCMAVLLVNYLCNEHFISISRESFPHFSGEKVSYRYGEPISVKITEQGKSYIAERKHEFTKLLFKDVFIPVVVSIITNLLILGLKLLQHWLLPQG